MSHPGQEDFLTRLAEVLRRKNIIRLVLGNSRTPENPVSKYIITPVELKQGYRLKVVSRYPTRDITRNFTVDEVIPLVAQILQTEFYNADLFTTDETIQLSANEKGKVKLSGRKTDLNTQPDVSHDHQKRKLIGTEDNIYLRELGILNAAFQVRREMADKYVQINRYIELLEPYLKTFGKGDTVRIADMGSGKGYLTFSLYDYMTRSGFRAEITGVEIRDDLVEQSNTIAGLAGFSGLNFIGGSIQSAEITPPDILIALHACDTATDDAIFYGITHKTPLIVVAPCCHKQVRKALNVPPELKPLVQYGIVKERQAEILTDVIRGMILDAYGYATAVIEFTDIGHTPKNVMIIGKRTRANNKQSIIKVEKFMHVFGLDEHYLFTKINTL